VPACDEPWALEAGGDGASENAGWVMGGAEDGASDGAGGALDGADPEG
jgi:hypothetical protein